MTIRATVIFALVGVLAFAQADAGPAPGRPASRPGRDAFETGLKVAQKAAAGGRAKAARDQIAELLRAHEGAEYALARKVEIAELVKNCCFAIEHPAPNPKTLVSGELLSWDPATGAIKIRYAAEKMGDWLEQSMRIHPMRFRGPYSIELKGSRYPPPTGDAVEVLVCGTEGSAVIAVPGAAAESNGGGSVWLPARLVVVEKDEKDVVDKKDHPPCRAGKPYSVKVRVGESGVVVTVDGQTVLSGKRLKEWGHAGFRGGNPDEVILEGRAEGSWIQGLVDAAQSKHREAFERSYDPKRELPDWFLSGKIAARAAAAARESEMAWPDDLQPSHYALVGRATKLLEKDDLATGIVLLERLKPGELPEATKNFLLARFYEEADRLAECEMLLDRVRAASPKYWPSECIRGRVLVRTGRGAQAADLYDKLLAAAPDECEVVADAATASLMIGRTSRAKAMVDAALARHLACEELDKLNTVLVKAINGPPWAKRFEYQSQNFVVASDIDRKTCEDAAKLLEDGYLAYSTWLDRVPTSGTDRFKVYLFSGEAGYQAWTRDVMGSAPQHTAGLYTPLLKILLIWNLPSREQMMRTVRHEGFHQYLDRLVAEPPIWFNEGLAEYFENAKLENGTWKPNERHPQHEEALAQNSLTPLSTFLLESRGAFYRQAASRYAQAWALITFLRHSTPENKQLFQKLWTTLRENVGAHTAVKRVFTEADMTRLDRELAAWVRSRR